MKLLPFLCALGAAVLAGGCSEIADTVRSGRLLREDPPLVRTVPGNPRAAYAAAQTVLAQMGFRATGGGPAQGELRAVSAVMAGENPDSAHQFTLQAKFEATLDGTGTEVSLRMTEVVEADSVHRAGQGTETPLRDTGLARVFFDSLETALGAPPIQG